MDAGLGLAGARASGREAGGGFDAALREALGAKGGSEPVAGEVGPGSDWEKRVKEERERRADPERVARAQKGAEQLVAATFIMPILAQLRESNNAAAPFGPGMYEKRMGPMLDAHIADRIVSAQRLPIVDAVRDRMLGIRESRVKPEEHVEGA